MKLDFNKQQVGRNARTVLHREIHAPMQLRDCGDIPDGELGLVMDGPITHMKPWLIQVPLHEESGGGEKGGNGRSNGKQNAHGELESSIDGCGIAHRSAPATTVRDDHVTQGAGVGPVTVARTIIAAALEQRRRHVGAV